MVEYLPFAGFAAAFAALAAWLIRSQRRASAARREHLARLGFVPAPEEEQALAERVARLENNREYRVRVSDPLRVSLGGGCVHHYTKERHRSGEVTAVEEVLLPLARPSPEGVLLFLKPSSLSHGLAMRAIGSLAGFDLDAYPDDLAQIELPLHLQGSNVVAARGPAWASVADLFEAKQLDALQHAGDAGVLVVTCRGGDCSLSAASLREPLDLEKLWPLVRQLAGAPSR